MPEEEIDTSYIPKVCDCLNAKHGLFYTPVKKQITMRVYTA
jgi:hypothetical protein